MYERNKDSSLPYPDNIIRAIDINQEVTDDIRNKMLSVIHSSELLSKREKHCLIEYYKNNRTYIEIGKDYSITRERIRQVIELGLSKLRRNKNLIIKE